jgi:hypothetical protein
MKRTTTGLLAALAVAALAAACGPTPPAEVPAGGTAQPAASGAPGPSPAASVAPGPSPSATAAAGVAPPVGTGSNSPLQASALVADAKKLGIDFTKPMSQLPFAQKKQVMPLLKKALGFTECTGCHVEGDFKRETRNIKIARKMWDKFVVALRDEKGEPIFCDSCHAGKQQHLDRADKAATKNFMHTDYELKMTRADKSKHACASCHGTDVEIRIFEKMWSIPAK